LIVSKDFQVVTHDPSDRTAWQLAAQVGRFERPLAILCDQSENLESAWVTTQTIL
jgi:hypothetical protein